jgi:hypothetical protein
MLRVLCATAAAALACAAPDDPPPPLDLEPEYGLSLPEAPSHVARLAWHSASDDCPLAYRVRIDETYPEGLAEFMHTRPEHSESLIVFGRGVMPKRTWPAGPVPRGEVEAGQLLFRGPKTAGRDLLREWALSATTLGPGSPDAACYERTWDPVEDALALGWPALPDRATRVGEAWRGAKVEARCNRAACVDPETRGGGPEAHMRPCTTMSWRERLVGLHVLGDRTVAQLAGLWSDGNPLDAGLWSERTALVDVEAGRLLRAEVFIHHNFSGIERRVVVDAVDACPGGLVAAGWTPPAAVIEVADALRRNVEGKQGSRT